MDREIGRLTGHVIICGWGRVGWASAQYLTATGERFVVIDRDAARLEGLQYPTVLGDVTDDSILQAAGIASARAESSKSKLVRAGADRAVNPQLIGGRRMAAFALAPHVAEFLDVVMHDEALEFRMEQVEIAPESSFAGRSLREAVLAETTGWWCF